MFGYANAESELEAMANVVTDLLVPGIWHIGLFIVATARHGGGDAHRLYDGIEDWARANGATWLRLGVVRGNERAERFWSRVGYVEVRTREGLAMGKRINTVRVMVKSLAGETLDRYLQRVPRDQPGAA